MQTDMTPQYEAELKRLHKQLGTDHKRVERQTEALARRRKANDKQRDKAIRAIRRAAAQMEKLEIKSHRLADRPLVREAIAINRVREKREAAVQKRIDILTGRLAS